MIGTAIPTKPPDEYIPPNNARPSLTLEGCREVMKEIAPYFGTKRCASYYDIKNASDKAAWDNLFSGWIATLWHFTDADLTRAWRYMLAHKEDFRSTSGEFYPPTPTILEDALRARVRQEEILHPPPKQREEKTPMSLERLEHYRKMRKEEIAKAREEAKGWKEEMRKKHGRGSN
mgnify:CR=1 FL=1|tara:strand:+ start:332 stop:856 length:525 start_codon:yes stop_codon:yes gene_type:complete